MKPYEHGSFSNKNKFTSLDKLFYQTPENKNSCASHVTIIPIWVRFFVIIPLLIADGFLLSHFLKVLKIPELIFACVWCIFMGLVLILLLFSAIKRPAKNLTITPKVRSKSTLFDPKAQYTFQQDTSKDKPQPLPPTSIHYLKIKLQQRQATPADLTTLRNIPFSKPKEMFACLELQGLLPKDTEITLNNMCQYSNDQLEEIVDTYLHFFQKRLTAADIVYAYSWFMISAQEALHLLRQGRFALPKTEAMLEQDTDNMDAIVETFEMEYYQPISLTL